MWVVRVALQKPHTFVALALLLLILGPLAILRTPKDVFPNIGIPVISVIFNYNGLPPGEMGDRIVGIFERYLTTTVNDVEHSESTSLNGISVVKIFFHPRANIDVAQSQVTSISNAILRNLPPGTTPPFLLIYNASTVPILQLALTSQKTSEQEIFDIANSLIRSEIGTVPGASIPYPLGGKTRQVQVDLNQPALQAHGLSPQDVQTAVAAQNLIIPAGTEKIGSFEYNIKLNGSPLDVEELNDLPIRTIAGSTLYLRDVAHTRDGYAPQQNIVRVNGQRSVLMTIQKTGSASTLDVVDGIKSRLPHLRDILPPDFEVRPIADQSVFVEAAIAGVIQEGVLAAALTAAMILLFLRSWRSTLIIVLSIPLSALASIILLAALGETINIMTLGGLALAVGILVDDATVAIENINWHLEHGKDVETAILDGAEQIALPALVSTLCICIVFAPMFFLAGVPRYLFVPLAEAVAFAMLASYILSRTLVPTLAKYWLRPHVPQSESRPESRIERGFDWLRARYRASLTGALAHRWRVAGGFLAFTGLSFLLVPYLGADFFPTVDAGQIKLHLRAHNGTRVEETARLCEAVENAVREIVPAADIQTIVQNIGLPISGINLSYSNSGTIGTADADILIALKPEHTPVATDIARMRNLLPSEFPGVTFSFPPADIVSQILNFGLPGPIDIQVIGQNAAANRVYAETLLAKMAHVPGIADLRIQQASDAPEFRLDVDRSRAKELGIDQKDVAGSLLISLAGSFQTAPAWWLNPKNGISYPVVTQTPQYQLDSLDALRNLPVTGSPGSAPQILGALAAIERGVGPAVVAHWNGQPVIDILASAEGRDLGGIGSDLQRILADTAKDLPRGSKVQFRGQVQTMETSFTGLYQGLLFSVVLVFLLIVVNFQSWLSPLIIIAALPAAAAGIVWMLFLTGTPLSVPALTGAIMTVGVATANSILVVAFARERMHAHGDDPGTAALAAGIARFRPVLMTALAMIIGMVPMALGLGDGGEQNAPLGRAAIGGLLFATVATLFFVPVVFSLLHRHTPQLQERH